jgi:hypothetical protein
MVHDATRPAAYAPSDPRDLVVRELYGSILRRTPRCHAQAVQRAMSPANRLFHVSSVKNGDSGRHLDVQSVA